MVYNDINNYIMVNCERCKKSFRDQYNLTCHMSRKNKCKEIVNDTIKQNEPEGKQNELNPKHFEPKNKQFEPSCEFCFKTFFNTQSLTRHYNCCKAQDDPIRQIEIEAGIKPVLPECLTECRFCNKVLSSTTILNKHRCTAREKYHNDLKRGPSIVNNNTTNNTTNNIINNGTIIFNQESCNLEIPNVMNELKKINKTIGKAYNYLKAGTWITAVDTMIRSQPENQNVLITTKAMTGKILTAAGWITDTTDNILERCFQQSAIRLKQLEQQIKTDKFMETNKETWGEVGHFANHGLNWHGLGGGGANGDQIRRVRTGFKVALSRIFHGKLKKII